MSLALPNFLPALPEIFLAASAMLRLRIGVFQREDHAAREVSWLAVIVLLIAIALVATFGFERQVGLYGLFVTDGFGVFMKILVLIGAALSIVMSLRFNERERIARFEYPVLVLLATTGMMVMISANDLISLHLRLDLHNLPLYLPATFHP